MSKCVKIWLIIASSLVALGCIVFVVVMSILKWNFKKLSTDKYEVTEYHLTEPITSLDISIDTTDIKFLPSSDATCSVVCYEKTKDRHSVSVADGTLSIVQTDRVLKWYEHIGYGFGDTKITVYIPEGEYRALSVKSSTGDVNIPNNFKFKSIDILGSTSDVRCSASAIEHMNLKTSTGDIYLNDVSAASLSICTSTGMLDASNVSCEGDILLNVSGDAKLTNVTCKNYTSKGNTGDVHLENLIALEKISVTLSTGDLYLMRCDASELTINASTGDVSGSLLTDKIFVVKTSTGTVDVPQSTVGGACNVNTSTGDVNLEIIK